ncbi:MAG: methyltransferase domain-containing protein [Candidatus Woesearchaeota archaeon]
MENRRWSNYRKANDKYPAVRSAELDQIFERVNPRQGEIIAEFGTGNGYLTFPLARAVCHQGRVITFDVMEENLESVIERNLKFNLPIETRHQPPRAYTGLPAESVDAVASIATFHHYDSTRPDTGTKGRLTAMKEWARVLKYDGQLVVGDVMRSTAPSTYFNAIDSPTLCAPEGHPHEFMDEELVKGLCTEAGLELSYFQFVKTPWVFNDEKEAGDFLNVIHNSQASKQESLQIAKDNLQHWQEHGKFYLGWGLAYFEARKPRNHNVRC